MVIASLPGLWFVWRPPSSFLAFLRQKDRLTLPTVSTSVFSMSFLCEKQASSLHKTIIIQKTSSPPDLQHFHYEHSMYSKTSFQGSVMHSPLSCQSFEEGMLCHCQLPVRDMSVSHLRQITYNTFLPLSTNLNLRTAIIFSSFLDCSRRQAWDYPCRPFQEFIS